jgi:(p)ppGpp synthase/HD superfamily hydrolase
MIGDVDTRTNVFTRARESEYLLSHHLAVPVSPRFHDALAYASILHAAQARKTTQIPYVAHLLAVASIVMEAEGTEDEAIAALLHDAAEDQGGEKTLEDIRRRFGDTVEHIVAECSDTFADPKPEWRKRKREYIERLRTADTSTLLVSAADKLHNARATLRDLRVHGTSVWKRFSAPREQTLENYRALIAAYNEGAPDDRRTAVVRELSDLVDQMEMPMSAWSK